MGYLRGQKKDDAGQHGAKSNTPINPQTDYFQNSRYPPRRSQCQREGASDTFISRQKTKIIIGLVALVLVVAAGVYFCVFRNKKGDASGLGAKEPTKDSPKTNSRNDSKASPAKIVVGAVSAL